MSAAPPMTRAVETGLCTAASIAMLATTATASKATAIIGDARLAVGTPLESVRVAVTRKLGARARTQKKRKKIQTHPCKAELCTLLGS